MNEKFSEVILLNNEKLLLSLDTIKKITSKYNVKVYVFGSYIWGTPRNDSDLDLAIDTNSISVFFDIVDEIENSDITLNCDILKMDTLNNNKLKERIIKYGKQI